MVTKVANLRTHPPGPDTVYIGRAGHGHDGYFGNPYRLGRGTDKGSTLEAYRAYLWLRLATDAVFHDRVWAELRGKTLLCFCKPGPCHGDVLAEYLNG